MRDMEDWPKCKAEFPSLKGHIFQLCFLFVWKVRSFVKNTQFSEVRHVTYFHETPPTMYEGWNFNRGNYLFTTDTK